MSDVTTASSTPLRRAPSQKRALERIERIVDAARALIAEKGSDAMKMAEVAERAGVSIGSLYQYFPDKTALIRLLAERLSADCLACIETALSDAADAAGLRAAFAELFEVYYAMFRAEPVMRDVWSATQGDASLRAMEVETSRRNAAPLAAAMARVYPDADRAAQDLSAFLVIHLGEAAVRTAVSVPQAQGDALVEAFVRMALAEIAPGDGVSRTPPRRPRA